MKKLKIICGLALVIGILGTAIVAGEEHIPIWLKTLTFSGTSESSTYTHRIILLSDVHYMPNESKTEYEILHPGAIAPDEAGDMLGYTQTERMQIIVDDINKFMKKADVEAVLTLGDLSTDDYGYRSLTENYVVKYQQDVVRQLPCDTYALPGNHDSYPNARWNEIFGYNRQYSVKIGDAAFIMLDTYNDVPMGSPDGSDYTGIDVEWLEQEIAKYPTEQIFICAHYLDTQEKNADLQKLLSENERIVCMFMGHTHGNEVFQAENLDERYVVNVSGYACMNGETYDDALAWGFGVLEWNETEAHYYHVKYPRTYKWNKNTINFAGAIENEITMKFK